jgi:hypothetical protein
MYTNNFGGTTEFCCPEFFQTGRFEILIDLIIIFFLCFFFIEIVVNHF